MYLIVSIDTEEEFDWRSPFSHNDFTTDFINIHHDIMMDFYDKENITPIMSVTYPIIEDHKNKELILQYVKEKRIILASHLHPWVTPPFNDSDLLRFNTYAGNLSYDIEYSKLKTLTKAIVKEFNINPTIYKAGRYGIGHNTNNILKSLGYKYDLSLFPKKSFSYDGGFNQSHLSCDIFKGEEEIIHIPVSGFFVGSLSENNILQKANFNDLSKRIKFKYLLSALNICEYITLSPESMPFDKMKQATIKGVDLGIKVFHMTFHSSIFKSGNIPFYQTQDDIHSIVSSIKDYISFFKDLGGKSVNVDNFSKIVNDNLSLNKQDLFSCN